MWHAANPHLLTCKVSAADAGLPDNFCTVPASIVSAGPGAADPADPAFPEFAGATQTFCEVRAGQMLYLPASWFHEVSSFGLLTCG